MSVSNANISFVSGLLNDTDDIEEQMITVTIKWRM